MFLGILLSFVVAVVVHYTLEKPYLGWGKPATSAVVAVFFRSPLPSILMFRQSLPDLCRGSHPPDRLFGPVHL